MKKKPANLESSREQAAAPRHAGFFVLRSPLLAADEFAGKDPLEALGDPIVQEAVARASPSLVQIATDPQRVTPAARLSLERYLSRMRRRATPFSLMAGYSFGQAGGESTPISLPARETWRRIVRVDVDSATAIVQSSMTDHACREKAQWLRRSDLGILPDVVRVAVRDLHNRDSLVFTDVVRSAALDHVFHLTEEPISFDGLVDGLRQFSPEREEARSYVHALIDRGLLIPFALPSVAADDVLAALPEAHSGLAATAAEVFLNRLDHSIDAPIQLLTAQIAEAQQSDRPDNLIFDLVKPLDSGVIGDDILTEALAVLRVLQRTTSPTKDARLAEFSEKFRDRYEMREVPLVEALDENRGYPFPVDARYEGFDAKLKKWIFSLFERACREGVCEIILQDGDLPPDELWQPKESFSMMFKLARDPLCIFEPSIDPSPGTAFFARAASFEPELKEAAKAMLRELASQRPDADMAEIVHFLPGKFAAFGQVPRLMPLELSLAARPADIATSIDVNDLLLSCAGGKFRLRSSRTGRPVLPRAIGAANLNRPDNTSLCRFIGALARYPRTGGSWRWEGLEHGSWLPRIRYGDHVLSSQSWRLGEEDTAPLLAAKTDGERRDAVARLRTARGLPRHISYWEHSDNLLAVDLDDDWSIAAWLDIAKSEMRVAEQFPVERSSVSGANGLFHHELLVPFLVPAPVATPKGDGERAAAQPAPARPVVPLGEAFDRVVPGGETLYFTLTGDRSELLRVTSELYHYFVQPEIEQGTLDRWFFLPYSAPDDHIRLRCFGRPDALHALLSAVNPVLQSFVTDRVLRSVSIDTYDRETYRYGGAYGLELCERVFQASSEFAVGFHDQIDIADGKMPEIIPPWVGSLRAILDATGISLEDQRDIARLAARLYHRDPPPPKDEKPKAAPRSAEHKGGDIYREVKSELLQSEQITPGYHDLLRNLSPIFPLIREGITSGRIAKPFEQILVDLLHVHSIRLLTTWAGDLQLEEVGYHVLVRSITTELHIPNRVSRDQPPAALS